MTATVILKKFIKESHAVMSSSFIMEVWLKERKYNENGQLRNTLTKATENI